MPATDSEGCGAGPRPSSFLLRGVRVYCDPESDPVDDGEILVRSGRIAGVGEHVSHDPDTRVVPLEGKVVAPGFWNCHVHLTERKWTEFAGRPRIEAERALADMCGSRGFTSVVDLGSNPRVTLPIRDGLRSGTLSGPALFTAGTALYPPKGLPYYLRGSLPWYAHWFIPQPSNPSGAVRAVTRALASGIDLVKLFTGSYIEPGVVRPMPLSVARAATEVAHAHRRLVFAHPSNLEGTRIALESGVDVLAHAPDATEGIDEDLLRNLVRHRTAMVPTLKMFASTVTRSRSYLDPILAIVRRFRELGGELLFGTDVGYMPDYSTDEEFAALAETGADWRAILRMLTTAPARRFGQPSGGTIAPGLAADLVILDRDPASDVRAFGSVHLTFRDGRPIGSRNQLPAFA